MDGAVPQARALYDYEAQHVGDLSLREGAIIQLTRSEGGWWEGILDGAKGIFPSNYVEKI